MEPLSLWEAAKRGRHMFLMADQIRQLDPTSVISVCAATLYVTTLATMKPGKLPPGNAVTFIHGGGRCHIFNLMRAARIAVSILIAVLYAPTVVESAAPSSDSSELEEVIVTATRRSESNDKVPISIVALSGADLNKSGVKGISDLAALIPGIEFDNQTGLGAGSVTNIAIRGVEPTAGASTTGIYIDDTAIQGRLTNASAFGNPYPLIFDLDRVEVLRGPQGTLFGAGAEGGAVRFIQQEPGFTNFSAKAVAELSTTKDGNPSYEAGVAGGGPLVDDAFAFRASAWHRTDGGYVDHVDPFTLATTQANSNVTRSNAARLALAYRPIESLTISPSIYWQDVDVNDTGAFYEYLSSKDHLKNGRLLQQPADDSFYLASLKVDANLSFADLTSVTSYFHRYGKTVNDLTNFLGLIGGAGFFPLGSLGYGDPRGPAYPTSYADAAPQYSLIRQQITSEEIRLTSLDPNAPLTWLAGLYFSHAHQEDPNTIVDYYIPNPPAISQPVFYQNPIEIDKQVAVFGQLGYTIFPGLKASAGVRLARASVHAEEISSGIFAGLGPCCSTQDSTEHPITPRVALSYQADDRNLFYVSAAKGYRLGGGNVPPSSVCKESAPLSYASDSVWSYEVGAKNRVLDDRVQLETSVFHIDWSNLQQNILLADCGASYVTNAGKAVSNGFDFSAQALLTSQLRGVLSLSYQNAHFTQTITAVGGPIVIVQSGDSTGSLPQVPSPWNATLSLEYNFHLLSHAAYIRAEDIFHSKNNGPFPTQIPGSISYEPDLRSNPSTNLLNLRVGATWGVYDASVFINNALNSQPFLGRWVDAPGSTLFTDSTFRPLTLGINILAHF
jgi:iron complex outermembrane receptor protein